MAMSGPSPRPVTGPSPRAIMSPAVRPRSVTRPSPSASSPLAVAGTKRPAPSSAIAALERAKKQKLAPGNAWIVAQVEEMQRHYKVSTVGESSPKPKLGTGI
jgi:hypothetical protein